MPAGRLERLLPLSGALFAIIMAIGFFGSGQSPDTTDSPEKIFKYYDDGKLFLGIISLGLGGILFMFFAAAMRKYLRDTGPDWLAALWFGGAVIFTVGIAGFASSQFALLSAAQDKNLSVMPTLNYIDNNNFPPAIIALAIIMFATAWHVLSSRSLPTWLGWVTLVLGILALAGPLGFLTFLAFMPWTLLVSILVYRRSTAVVVASTAV
jgi:hypothetical protein